MQQTLRGLDADRLERSCGPSRDWIRVGASAPGIERAEACFSARPFEPHRHDTYAVGLTVAGVQTFRYRGERRVSLPGQLQILHPDETHDGAAGTSDGFRYRIVYVEPGLIRAALDGGPLPFVSDPVQERAQASELARVVEDVDEPVGELGRAEIAVTVADALQALGGRRARAVTIDVRAVELVREYLASNPCGEAPASMLERIAGIDRFTIARHFRRAFGTSPDRYRLMRRLGVARKALEQGVPLAEAAADAGFADQSHLTRQFKRAFGMTPGAWAKAVSDGRRVVSHPA
jgi:AraC-like DNA-binding protein